MGEWQESVVFGLAAGVLVAVLGFVLRSTTRKWTSGARLGLLIVAAIAVGATAPAVLHPVERRMTWPWGDDLARLASALRSPELGRRVTALEELGVLARTRPSTAPRIVELVSGFVRERAPEAGDPRCAGSEPAEDVGAALAVLRARLTGHDSGETVDLRRTCLANADLRALPAPRGNFAGANLTGANLTSAELDDADLHDADLTRASLAGTSLTGTRFAGARFAGTDLEGARFSDDTFWPPQLEDAVMAASSFATSTFVIGALVLSGPP